MPLRSIIQSFLSHVHELEVKSQEGEDLFEQEYQELKTLSDEFRTSSQCSCSAGEQDVNRRKNRYKDILPYDNNRVVLPEIPGVPGSDYVNASFIKGASGSQSYIASQAPLPHTVEDFWRMICDCHVQIIIMACNEIEGGRHKCERYWPDDEETKEFGDISVSLDERRVICPDYNARKLKVVQKDAVRTIHHFHYHTWPDHGVPLSVKAILDMVMLVREFQTSEILPVLIHCSAGCGRTGTICAIDYVCGLLRTGKLNEEFNLKQLVFDMRRQRIAMVQTKEQYVLLHRAVEELFSDHIKVIDSHPYENIDFSGRPLPLKEEPDYANITPVDIAHQQSGLLDKSNECKSSKGLEEQGQNNLSCSNVESAIHHDKRSSIEKLLTPDTAPPLPIKTKVGNALRDASENVLNSSCEASPNTSHRSRNHSPALFSNKSKMEYVNDWCDGITVSKQDGVEGTSHSENYRNSDLKTLPVSTSCTPSTQSPSPSPNSKRSKTPERSHKMMPDRPRISNLVRKPSIAKFKALFESDGNTDSSGPPSPDSGAAVSSRTKLKRGLAKSDSSVAGHAFGKEVESNHLVVPARTKHKLKSKRIYVDNAEYKTLTTRYEDTSFRLFKENNQCGSDEVESQYTKMVNSSPSPSAWSVSSAVNTSDSRDEPSKSNSENLDSSSQAQLHTSCSSSHSPSPVAPSDDSSNLPSESVAHQAKELVGRLVGPRRNSFAEKRSSTWYDDETVAEISAESLDKASPQQNNHFQNKVALFFGGSLEKKGKHLEDKKSAAAVKRSISMKVGFRSPLIGRKHNGNENVAAYLAVEDSSKSKPDSQARIPGNGLSSGAAAGGGIAPGPRKPFRHLQGYVNAKPVQNPTFYHLGGGPVELTKFTVQNDEDDAAAQEKLSEGKVNRHATKQPIRALHDIVAVDGTSPSLNHRESPFASPVILRKGNRRAREGSPIRLHEPNPSCESRNRSPRAGFIERTLSDQSIGKLPRGERQAYKVKMGIEPRPQDVFGITGNSSAKVRQRLSDDVFVGASIEVGPPDKKSASLKEPVNLPTGVGRVKLPADEAHDGSAASKGNCSTEAKVAHDNSFGAEMDEYCQKIIHDCQEYLVNHHQYSNLTPEAQCNLRWIEETLQQSPRRAIVDVTSSSAENLELEPDPARQVHPGALSHDYERLWFSRSGQTVQPSSSVKEDTENTSVEEVTLIFPPHEDDYDDHATLQQHHISEEFCGHYPAVSAGRIAPVPATRTLKDAKFCKAVSELKSLIDELEVELPVKPRKPQPAPRTILTASTAKCDSTFCRMTDTKDGKSEKSRVTLLSDCDDQCTGQLAHIYECVGALEAPERVNKSTVEHPYVAKVENLTLLRAAASEAHDRDKGNHEYEEILFVDCNSDWSKRHIYEWLRADNTTCSGGDYSVSGNCARSRPKSSFSESSAAKLQNCKVELDCAGLYGRVNKPRRKKHNLKVEKHNAGEVGSASPYTNVDQWQQRPVENDYESLSVMSDWKEFNDNYPRPIAPPRVRRNPSSASCSSATKMNKDVTKDSGVSRDRTLKTKNNKGLPEDLWLLPRNKWEAEFDDDDEDDNIPPVPVKTKDAYRLPKGATGGSSQNANCSPDAEGSGSHGATPGHSLSKALTKLHTNFISRLAIKNEKDSDSSSIGSGSGTPPSSHKISNKPTTGLGFPHRLDKKPKGPRDPPPHWKVTA